MDPGLRLQLCYELAFFPPRLNAFWTGIRRGDALDKGMAIDLIDTALLLHQALPESGYASQRALRRLAKYQADARAFGLPLFLRNIRRHLAGREFEPIPMPPGLVRDIGLPPFDRDGLKKSPVGDYQIRR